MSFPIDRPRRLRRTESLRGLVRETRLATASFIYPMFVCPGNKVRKEVSSMPGVYQQSVDQLVEECREVETLGLPGVILFGLPEKKDRAWREVHLAPTAWCSAPSKRFARPSLILVVITDVCLCEYTDHGHCGVIENGRSCERSRRWKLLADRGTFPRAGRRGHRCSLGHDGRPRGCDSRKHSMTTSFENIPIISYAAKYCSGFYGPFREAAESAPKFGDRRSYQMDPANSREAMREVELDLEEGADVVMVKPALALPGYHSRGTRSIRRARSGLQCQRRIFHGESRGAEQLD